MTPNEYQKLAERTSATASEGGITSADARIGQGETTIRLLHGVMGLCTEAGEAQDVLKKWIFYGKEPDLVELGEEMGDTLWYVMEVLNALGVDLEFVMQQNIEKLRTRYPDKFTEDKAINRDLDAERAVLEREKHDQT